MSTPLLQLQNVTVRRNGRTLLEHIDLSLAKGEIVTLMGPNGAGKTTVLRTLLGQHPLSEGTVFRQPELRIGYVPQHFTPPATLPMTVESFIRQGSAGQTVPETLWAEALELTRADHLRTLPLHQLSGGERQRALLARAILRRPQALLLDEPVQGVDLAGQVEFYQQLGVIRDRLGCAILLVSHDLHWVMAASDRVLCINRHICCLGKPEDVRQHPEFIQMFGKDIARQLAVYSHHHDHSHTFGEEETEHQHGPECRHA